MDYAVITIDAPMQAWSVDAGNGTRGAGDFPTRSGIAGMIGAALGVDRADDAAIRRLNHGIVVHARWDTEPAVMWDDQNIVRPVVDQDEAARLGAGFIPHPHGMVDDDDGHHAMSGDNTICGSYLLPIRPVLRPDMNSKERSLALAPFPKVKNVQTRRGYLTGGVATVLVAVVGDAGHDLPTIVEAMRSPIHPPYAGRACCRLQGPAIGWFPSSDEASHQPVPREAVVSADDPLAAFDRIAPISQGNRASVLRVRVDLSDPSAAGSSDIGPAIAAAFPVPDVCEGRQHDDMRWSPRRYSARRVIDLNRASCDPLEDL